METAVGLVRLVYLPLPYLRSTLAPVPCRVFLPCLGKTSIPLPNSSHICYCFRPHSILLPSIALTTRKMKLLPRVATRRLPVPLLLLLDLATAALQPMVIRKMSPDESEKFFPHYVAFPEDQLAAVSALQKRHHPEPAFSPSFPIHVDDPGSPSEDETLYRRAAAALARLQRRQWGCPAGTASCSNIGHPDRCCRQTETCYKIDDTGLGSVGCCANGSTCGGTISNCAPGDTACPASMGGGCCIAGFVCQGVGCRYFPAWDIVRDDGGIDSTLLC